VRGSSDRADQHKKPWVPSSVRQKKAKEEAQGSPTSEARCDSTVPNAGKGMGGNHFEPQPPWLAHFHRSGQHLPLAVPYRGQHPDLEPHPCVFYGPGDYRSLCDLWLKQTFGGWGGGIHFLPPLAFPQQPSQDTVPLTPRA
jgi:hypothetical protein